MSYFLNLTRICIIFVILFLYPVAGYTKSLAPNDIAEIRFPDFSGVDDYLSLNGEAKIVSDSFSSSDEEKMILRLTPRKSNSEGLVAGSAFLKIPFVGTEYKNYAFSCFFRFRITANNIYDGSGIIQADSRKYTALAKQKNGMGYDGSYLRGFKSITPSVGIKFNVQIDEENDIDYNTIGTVKDGSIEALYPPYGYPVAENPLNNGLPWNVWIDYDGEMLSVRTTQSPEFALSTVHTNRPFNLKQNLSKNVSNKQASPDVYVGFTSDPGFNPAYHDILEWHFRPFYKPYGDYCGDAPEDRPDTCLEAE